jgi:hypothetical protein
VQPFISSYGAIIQLLQRLRAIFYTLNFHQPTLGSNRLFILFLFFVRKRSAIKPPMRTGMQPLQDASSSHYSSPLQDLERCSDLNIRLSGPSDFMAGLQGKSSLPGPLQSVVTVVFPPHRRLEGSMSPSWSIFRFTIFLN